MLTRGDGTLDITRMSSLVDQIAELHKRNIELILVSSGAVASGRSVVKPKNRLDSISARQLYSSVGQTMLMSRYADLFKQHGIICGQVLSTKEDFSTRRHYLNQRHCMQVMLENNVLPIVNENDTVSVNELMFTDNDELSGLVAAMMGCSKLIILSNIDGIYNGDPDSKSSQVIPLIDGKKDIEEYIQPTKSSNGRGGMVTKYNIARKVSEEGIEVIIANGKKDNILIDVLFNENAVCTRFLAAKKKYSSIKKWIAHSDGFAKGEICIDANASKALLSKHASLLPVGIVSVSGNFEADDIVRIMDEKGKQIGIGRTSFNSKDVDKIKGLAHQKAIIHYNYLFIEKQ